MTRTQQKKFIRSLCRAIEQDVTTRVMQTKETEAWDGHELRVLLRDHFQLAAGMSSILQDKKSERAREYYKVVASTNIL